MGTENRYGFSLDGERFEGSFATRQEAEVEARGIVKERDLPEFYTGKLTLPNLDIFSAPLVIDNGIDTISEEGTEVPEDWPNYTMDQLDLLERLLNNVFKNWVDATGNTPEFGSVEEVEVYKQEDNKDWPPCGIHGDEPKVTEKYTCPNCDGVIAKSELKEAEGYERP